MLPRSRRVPTSSFQSKDPSKLQSKSFHGSFFSIRANRSTEPFPSRFAIIVSKKVAKSAVSRNKIRRRLYEAVKTVIRDVKPGFVILIYPKKEAQTMDFRDLCKNVRDLLAEARILQ